VIDSELASQHRWRPSIRESVLAEDRRLEQGRDREGQDAGKDIGEQERKAMTAPGDLRQNRPDAGWYGGG
jgi:hypothetical protein